MIVTSSDEMREFGKKVAGFLLQETSPKIVLLDGPLGAGKTELAKGIVEGLGVTELVTSPTFSIVNQYSFGDIEIYHIDLYRIQSEELHNLGIEELLEQPDAIVIVEWASLHPQLFDECCTVKLSMVEDEPSHRKLSLSGLQSGVSQWSR